MSVYLGHTCVDFINTAYGSSEDKPYAAELEYFIMTGKQHFNTQYIPTDIESQIKFNMTSQELVGGVLQASEPSYYQVCRYSGAWSFGTNGTEYSAGSPSLNTIYTMVYNQVGTHDFIVNGTVLKTGISNITSYGTLPLLIGGYRPNVSYDNGATIVFYSAQLTERSTGRVLRSFIPVVDEDGIACAYDSVSNGLFYNAYDTSSFTAGPVKS